VKILFMGTPDFAAEILKALHKTEEVAAVFTQPGKPKGRGHNIVPGAVEQLATELGIPCYTPIALRDGSAMELIREIDPELTVVVAYGKILPVEILDYPKYGSVCIHASLLPRWRGAAPIQRSIMAGDSETGVTTMMMDAGLDTGDMLVTEKVAILPEDDFGTLHDKLAEAGVKAILETIDRIKNGTLVRTPQPEEGITYAEKIEKADAVIDFNSSSSELLSKIRGLSPFPMAVTKLKGKLLKIASAKASDKKTSSAPGTIVSSGKDGIFVAVADGVIELKEVVPEGKRKMSAEEFARGHSGLEGEVLSWQ